MKMTMHIDEALLEEVMAATGAAAVHEALRKVAVKYRQRERWKRDLGMSAEELVAAFDPDVALGLRGHLPEDAPALVAECAKSYGG
jgi:hypothetical protein